MACVKNASVSTHERIEESQGKTSVNQGKHILSCSKVGIIMV